MLGWLEQVNESINGVVWGPVTLFLFLATGIWFTLGTGWFQLSKIGLIFRNTLGNLGKNRLRKNGGISPFQAMSTALAGTMGVGNITGIATAMTLGGAGSIFWMWISAFFGMMTNMQRFFWRYGTDKREHPATLADQCITWKKESVPKCWLLFSAACASRLLSGSEI